MIFELIKKRKSVRTFKDEKINKDDLVWIKRLVNEVNMEEGPNGHKIQFQIVNKDPNNDGEIAGTYGVIKNPQLYITAAIKNNNEYLEDFGYLLEKIIITLVKRNIGSCWLGGTFKRSDFNKVILDNEKDIIPAVIPIGYPSDKKRTIEKAMRFLTKADNKKEWSELFYYNDFTTPITEKGQIELEPLKDAFESVRLGPSSSNKQPWRLVYNNYSKKVHFYLNEDHKYSGNKLGFTMQRIDAGIAMYHFEAVAKEGKISGKWIIENPKLVPIKNYKYIKTYSY